MLNYIKFVAKVINLNTSLYKTNSKS